MSLRKISKLFIRFLSLFGLLVFSIPSFAKWEEIGRTTGATLYVDPTTISRAGDLASIYYLENLDSAKTISGKDVRAIASHYQFNCSNNQFRKIAFSFYSGPMGSGNQQYSSEKGSDWQEAGGAYQFTRKVACGLIVRK